jgi:centromere protein I
MTIEEVENADHLVENLENIEAPSQLVAGLNDPVMQKYVLLHTSTDLLNRLDFWLERSFEDELETLREGFGLSPTLSDLLAAIVSYTESTKVYLTQPFRPCSAHTYSLLRVSCRLRKIF